VGIVSLLTLNVAAGTIGFVNNESKDAHRTWIDPYSHTRHSISCTWGNIVYGEFSVESDDTVDFYICDAENYDLWIEGEDAVFIYVVTDVNAHSWNVEVPSQGVWVLVHVNGGPNRIRVSGSMYCTSYVKLVGIFGFHLAEVSLVAGLIFIHLSKHKKKRRNDDSSQTDTKPPDIADTSSKNMMNNFDYAMVFNLAGQAFLIVLVYSLNMIEEFERGSIIAGLGIIAYVYAILPLICAYLASKRDTVNPLLMIWLLFALVMGEMMLAAWQIASSNLLLFISLTFLIPSWISIALVGLGFYSNHKAVQEW
jgi:hypothetical protein